MIFKIYIWSKALISLKPIPPKKLLITSLASWKTPSEFPLMMLINIFFIGSNTPPQPPPSINPSNN